MNGNTALIAEKLAKRLQADVIEIKPETAYPDKGLRKFLWGGKSAVMAETPKLMPYTFEADFYEQIIIGFPVWAANIAPPIRSFVNDNDLAGHMIAAYACESGSGGEKALKKLEECIGQPLSATAIFIDPKDRPKIENERKLQEFISQVKSV